MLGIRAEIPVSQSVNSCTKLVLVLLPVYMSCLLHLARMQFPALLPLWFPNLPHLKVAWSPLNTGQCCESWSPLHSSETGSCPLATRGFSPTETRPEREVNRHPPHTVEFMNTCSYISAPPYVFMACCSIEGRETSVLVCVHLFMISIGAV